MEKPYLLHMGFKMMIIMIANGQESLKYEKSTIEQKSIFTPESSHLFATGKKKRSTTHCQSISVLSSLTLVREVSSTKIFNNRIHDKKSDASEQCLYCCKLDIHHNFGLKPYLCKRHLFANQMYITANELSWGKMKRI